MDHATEGDLEDLITSMGLMEEIEVEMEGTIEGQWVGMGLIGDLKTVIEVGMDRGRLHQLGIGVNDT